MYASLHFLDIAPVFRCHSQRPTKSRHINFVTVFVLRLRVFLRAFAHINDWLVRERRLTKVSLSAQFPGSATLRVVDPAPLRPLGGVLSTKI